MGTSHDASHPFDAEISSFVAARRAAEGGVSRRSPTNGAAVHPRGAGQAAHGSGAANGFTTTAPTAAPVAHAYLNGRDTGVEASTIRAGEARRGYIEADPMGGPRNIWRRGVAMAGPAAAAPDAVAVLRSLVSRHRTAILLGVAAIIMLIPGLDYWWPPTR